MTVTRYLNGSVIKHEQLKSVQLNAALSSQIESSIRSIRGRAERNPNRKPDKRAPDNAV